MSRSRRPFGPKRQSATRPENVSTAITNRATRASIKSRRKAADQLLMAKATADAAAYERLKARRALKERNLADIRRTQI